MTQSRNVHWYPRWLARTLSVVVMGVVIGSCPHVGLALDPEEAYKAGNESYQRNDWINAMAHLRKGAEVQHIPSMVLLAYILDHAEENAEAVDWYRKAAMLNSAEAALQLGIMQTNGEGTKKNVKEGVEWINRSAKLGHHPAMVLLARGYMAGEMGLTPDLHAAQKWLEVAAKGGHAPAIQELERLQKGGGVIGKVPVAAAPTSTQPVSAMQEECKAAIKLWTKAWSEKNLEAYRRSYVTALQATSEFAANDQNIQVTVDSLEIHMLDDSNAKAVFMQHYQSDNRKESKKKALLLHKEDGGWKIAKEETVP